MASLHVVPIRIAAKSHQSVWSQWGEINAGGQPSNAEIRGKAATTRKQRGKCRNLLVNNALTLRWFTPHFRFGAEFPVARNT